MIFFFFASLCRRFANEYLSSLRRGSSPSLPSCPTSSILSSPPVAPSANPGSLVNHVWERAGPRAVALSPGVGAGADGCCAAPDAAAVGAAWDRHRPALLAMATSAYLQGAHIQVEGAGLDPDFRVYLADRDLLLLPASSGQGHLWHLLPEGAYTVRVSVDGYADETKLVTVEEKGGFTDVVFAVEPKAPAVPRLVVACMTMTIFLLLLLCFMGTRCRRRRRVRSHLHHLRGGGGGALPVSHRHSQQHRTASSHPYSSSQFSVSVSGPAREPKVKLKHGAYYDAPGREAPTVGIPVEGSNSDEEEEYEFLNKVQV